MQSTTPVSRSAACELNWWRCIPDTLVVPHLVKRVGAADVGTSKSGVGTGKVIHAILFFSLTQTLQLFSTSSCPRRTLHQLSPCKYISIPQVFCRNFHCLRFKFLHFFFNRFFSSGAGWPNLFPASLKMPRPRKKNCPTNVQIRTPKFLRAPSRFGDFSTATAIMTHLMYVCTHTQIFLYLHICIYIYLYVYIYLCIS